MDVIQDSPLIDGLIEAMEESGDEQLSEFARKVKTLNPFQMEMIAHVVAPLHAEDFDGAATGMGAIFTFMIADMNKMRSRIRELENK